MTFCDCKTDSASCGCDAQLPAPGNGLNLAIATIPMQPWEETYDPEKSLIEGTIFPSLNLPFFVTGGGTNV